MPIVGLHVCNDWDSAAVYSGDLLLLLSVVFEQLLGFSPNIVLHYPSESGLQNVLMSKPGFETVLISEDT